MFAISRLAKGRKGTDGDIYQRRGAVPGKYIQKMAACAVLDKKVESTGCKNITANTGRRRKIVFRRQIDQIRS